MSELLKCPFCGGEAKPYNLGKKHLIECDDCKEYGHGAYVVAQTEAEAIEAWNTRHKSAFVTGTTVATDGEPVTYAVSARCVGSTGG